MGKIHTGPGGGADETANYTYNSNDELQSATSSLTGATTYSYDPNGSQLTATNGTTVTNDGYDVRNKMVSAAANGQTAQYLYDDAGNRVQETAAGQTTYYLTDTDNPTGYAQPLEEKSGPTAAPSRTYVIGDRVLRQADGSGAAGYLLTDGHGSTRALTSASGTLAATFNYDAFGGALGFGPNSTGTEFLFGGDAVYDPASGLYLHGDGTRARDGFRFTQMDSFGGDRFAPMSLNKYLYAGANPVMNFDPNGHEFSLSETVSNFAVQNVLGSILSPIVKPALSSLLSPLATALLPQGALAALSSAVPDAFVFDLPASASFTTGAIPGTKYLGVTGGGGLEWALAPRTGNSALYGYANIGASVGVGKASVSFGDLGAGAFFGGATSDDYTGDALNFYFPFAFLPPTWQAGIKSFLARRAASIVATANTAMQTISGELDSDQIARTVEQMSGLAGALIGNLDRMSVNIYAWKGGTWGFAVDATAGGLGDDRDNLAVAYSYDWQLRPSNSVDFG